MNVIRQISFVLLFVVCGLCAIGQQQHAPEPTSSAIIDGAQYPDLIPDSVAHRLYITAVAEMPSGLQHAQLVQAGLSDSDAAAAGKVLAEFSAKWHILLDQHNSRVDEGTTDPTTEDEFLRARDLLIENTLAQIQKVVLVGHFQAFTVHINGEKQHMKIGLNVK